jgi:hypothetical protein
MKLHRNNARAQRARARQAGTALVLFAVLVFALLGIAALTVDMGMASLSQSQMQTAADTASLEGVRLRDFYEYRPIGNIYRRPARERARAAGLRRRHASDAGHPRVLRADRAGRAQRPTMTTICGSARARSTG